MSDGRQRASVRAGQRGESERAQELRERMRVGDLSPERVRVAARLGDRASALAVGEDLPAGALLDRVEQATFRAGKQVLVRLALAAVRSVLVSSERPEAAADEVRAALEGWLAGGDPAMHEQVAAESARELWAGPVLVMGQAMAGEPLEAAELSRRAVATAGRVLSALPPYDRAELITTMQFTTEAVGEATLQEALLDELIPWATA